MTLAEKTAEIARSQIGVEEHPRGSNSGPEVDDYLKSVHLPPGNSWCAAFVSWCVQKATAAIGGDGGPPQFRGSGSALGLLQANPHLIVDEPADEACYVFVHEDSDHVHGHTGFVTGPLGDDGAYPTTEGNTNEGGSREGYGVFARSRRPAEIKAYLRIG